MPEGPLACCLGDLCRASHWDCSGVTELAFPPGLPGFLGPLGSEDVVQSPEERPIYRAKGM